MLKSKKKVLFSILALVVFGGLVVFSLPEKTNADMSGDADPSVNVTAGGSLALTNTTNVAWGDAAAGTTKNGTLNCTISTNTTTWDVKVATDGVLTSGSDTIDSTNFTYQSSFVSGTPNTGVTYAETDTEFATTPGTNVASISAGTAADTLNSAVDYTLDIPVDQAAASGYTATHTYTLVSS